MTIRECYEELGLDFDAVLSRLINERLVQKFALKFLDDPSFQNLKDALDSKDVETAFRAAHTLKGVCLNLGFDTVDNAVDDICTPLKCLRSKPLYKINGSIETVYNRILDACNCVGNC